MFITTMPLAGAHAANMVLAGARPDLNQVLSDYQTPDDRMTDWRPKAWGEITVPFSDKVRLTETEGNLLDNLSRDRGLVGLSDFKDIRDQAFAQSKSRYPPPSVIPSYVGSSAHDRNMWISNDGHRDAFRHTYWNALLTKNFGENWTRAFTTAHEGVPGNEASREAMDLYNNEVGRKIALDHPNASDEELADLVQKAVTEGKTVVIDGAGHLAWSDQVPYGQHGIAHDAPAPAAHPLPDATTSAN